MFLQKLSINHPGEGGGWGFGAARPADQRDDDVEQHRDQDRPEGQDLSGELVAYVGERSEHPCRSRRRFDREPVVRSVGKTATGFTLGRQGVPRQSGTGFGPGQVDRRDGRCLAIDLRDEFVAK